MGDPVTLLRALREPDGARLLAELPTYDPSLALALTDRLRRQGVPEDLAAAALTQSRLRARARAKFGPLADRLFFTEAGVQQATRPGVAARHASRYAGAGVDAVFDLACGIGSDLMALAQSGLDVTGVERDPLTAAVAEANLDALGLADRARVRLADISSVAVAELRAAGAVFVDPARRTGRGRTFDPAAYSPTFDEVLAIAAAVPATGAKLAPGIPHGLLPPGTEAEWVSDGGDVVECALWWGPLAGDTPRRATVLPSGATITGDGSRRAPVGPVGRYLFEPDGAVIRAGLVAEVAEPEGLTLLDGSIAYLSGDMAVASPFLTAYEVVEVLPFSLKRLRAALRARDAGPLTVKKRGTAVEPETLRRQLRLTGSTPATVVLTRVAGAQTALLVEPVAPPVFGTADHRPLAQDG